MSRIVIVGAGFVGLATARRVCRRLPDASVTLLDSKDRFVFTPRLIDALEETNYPSTSLRADLRALAERDGFTFIQGRVTSVDRDAKTLTYTPPTSHERTERLAYDILVLAQGAKPCFYNITGVAEHAIPLKIEEDAHHIHDRVRKLCTRAEKTDNDDERKRLMTFVAVGAGPSGVEALCALKKYTETLCAKTYPTLQPLLSWTLVQSGPQILPGFPLAMVAGARAALDQQGVTVCTGQAVTSVNAREVTTTQGLLPAGFVLWTAGIEPSRLSFTPDIHTDRAGYLPVDPYLQIAPCIFGGGDVVLYRESNVIIPKNAQTATRMAATLADNIVRCVMNQPLSPFHYHSRGNLLTVGRTGFIDVSMFVLQTRLTHLIRHLFYRFRFWQVTGL